MPIQQDETGSRWTRRKELTRRRLLEVGAHLFRTQGFDSTTIEDIAQTADVAKGTFFNYFESKERMLGEILQQRIQAILDVPPDAELPTWERVRLLLEAMSRELAPYRAVSRRMLSLALARPLPDPAMSPDLSPSAALTKLIREGQDRGDLNARVQAEVVATLLMTFFFRINVLECASGADSPRCHQNYLEEGLKALYEGLKPS